MLQAIAQFVSESLSWQMGDRLSYGYFSKTDPKRCVLISANIGEQPDFDFPDMVDKPVKFTCRAQQFTESEADAFSIFNLFKGESGITLPVIDSPYVVNIAEVISGPASFDQNDEGLYVHTVHLMLNIQTP